MIIPRLNARGPLTWKNQVTEDNTRLFLGNKVSVLVSGGDTKGKYATILTEERRGFEPPPHTHLREDETFFTFLKVK
ncbi:hypothetical protein DRW41_16395 [Neobacillus piezotolerans]|uniref:Uncharacterized protein n=1 Tax=Neobacillus piezotolerans TaxID=2259171 RepID=A0A3D8GN67_9BACI|nr:hypothetical protein DRW41_16395 [Neobacillus piezotolerans]